jgi:hypothetical protein
MSSPIHDVSEEHAELRRILDHPDQVHVAMGSYEGLLGRFKEDARRIGRSLDRKGGRALMQSFHDAYLQDVMPSGITGYAWHGIGGWFA